jgi:hypothetical protein
VTRRGERDSGNIAVLTAVVLLVVGGFMALSLNTGFIMSARGQLQNASDASALAAAGSLDGSGAGISSAKTMAVAYSDLHKVTNQKVTIDEDDDVELGRWHYEDCKWGSSGKDCFESIDPSATDPATGGLNFLRITAVKVRNGRDGVGVHNLPLDTHFGVFLGSNRQTKVPSAAVAVGNAAHADCPIPFGVASCKVVNGGGELSCDGNGTVTLSFGNANNDGVGFINVTGSDAPPSDAWVEDEIRKRACGGGQVYKTGEYPMKNGNNLNDKIIQSLLGLTKKGNGYDVTGPCLLYNSATHTPEVSVAVTNNKGCPTNPDMEGDQDVIAYAKARLLKVCSQAGAGSDAVSMRCDGSGQADPECTGSTGGSGNGNGGGGNGPQNKIILQLLCSNAPGYGGNGRILRLVQ